MSTVRIVQYLRLTTYANSGSVGQIVHRFQNYFVNETKTFNGEQYSFLPFRAEGAVANLNGDNAVLQVLLPNVMPALRLLEQGNGNRLSELILTTAWLNAELNAFRHYEERYIGIGSSFSETTIELRFRSAMDSVGAAFPARKLTRNLAGLLPLNADLFLQ